jgi:hypothetical protein
MQVTMARRIVFASLFVFALGAAGFGALPLRAISGNEEVEFPSSLGVLYGTVNRADLGQYRELYAPAAALAAVKEGKPLPTGAELTMIAYSIERDAAGQPIVDAEGRFVKNALVAYLVMRKRGADAAGSAPADAGAAWQFEFFGPDRRVDRRAKPADCAACHQKRHDTDFVFTDDLMRSFAPGNSAR